MDIGHTRRLREIELLCLCALVGGPPPVGLPPLAAADSAIWEAHLRLRRQGLLTLRPDGSAAPARQLIAPLATIVRPSLVALASHAPAQGPVARRSLYLDSARSVEVVALPDGGYGLTLLPCPQAAAGRLAAWWGLPDAAPGPPILLSAAALADALRLGVAGAILALLRDADVERRAAGRLTATLAAPLWRGALQLIAPAARPWLRPGLSLVGGAGGAWALRAANDGMVEAWPGDAATIAAQLAGSQAVHCRAVGAAIADSR